MTHPLESIKPERRPKIFARLLMASAALLIVVWSLPPKTDAAPLGIVSLELAGTRSEAESIFKSWKQEGKDLAELSLWLDFPFLMVYSTALALGCVWIARVAEDLSPGVAAAGLLLAWAQWVAAAFDAIGNIAMLIMLLLGPDGAAPAVAFWSALVKFLLAGSGLAYCLAGSIAIRVWSYFERTS